MGNTHTKKERERESGSRGWLARRRQVYSGDLDANERFEALFDIRHDFIKHSSNVQTLYIESYPPRPPPLLSTPWNDLSAPSVRPDRSLPSLTECISHRVPRVCRHGRARARACGDGTRHTMRTSSREDSLVMPQYRVMYNYITQRRRTGADKRRDAR